MNRLIGKIISIESEGSISLVEVAVGAHTLSATLLGCRDEIFGFSLHQEIALLFNEMEVAIAKNLSGQISLRNRLPGEIVSLESGKILTRVVYLIDQTYLVNAVITTRSASKLALKLGDQIEGLIKSNEMNLASLEAR